MDCWMLRTVALAVASTLVSTSTAALEVHTDGSLDESLGTSEVLMKESDSPGKIVAEVLESGKGKAASLLESLLASFDVLLVEFGLPATSVICVAVAVAVLALIFIRKAGGSGSAKRKGVLFLGPCGAGKTAMMHRLCHDRLVSTVTSMQTCKYVCKVQQQGEGKNGSGTSTSLVDYPGHERLRGGVRDELRRAERVVFVLDGSSLASEISAGAELFYDVLSDPSMEGCRGLLIALNKSDVKEAKPTRAKSLLQKEIEKLRGTRGTLGTQGEEDDLPAALALGRPGQPFNLEVDSPCEVFISPCSVKDGNLGAVVDFLRTRAL